MKNEHARLNLSHWFLATKKLFKARRYLRKRDCHARSSLANSYPHTSAGLCRISQAQQGFASEAQQPPHVNEKLIIRTQKNGTPKMSVP